MNISKYVFSILIIGIILTACGKEENMPVMPETRNLTLKEIDSVDMSEYTAEETEIVTQGQDPNYMPWSPRGNYTYVLVGASNGYTSAMIRVDSVDFDAETAKVSYVFADSEGNTRNSDGMIECRMSVTDNSDGTREITIRIDDNMYLEFKGTMTSRTAAVYIKDTKYNLKKEG